MNTCMSQSTDQTDLRYFKLSKLYYNWSDLLKTLPFCISYFSVFIQMNILQGLDCPLGRRLVQEIDAE